MTRFTVFVLSIIFSLTTLNARTIHGVVISSNDTTAVIGAGCQLLAGDRVITGVTTDTNGAFALSTDQKIALNLEISMTGYSPTSIIIESGAKDIVLGVIFLDESQQLGEVVVTGNSISNSKGRTIVYPSGSDVKSSGTSISLFQKLPLDGLQANPITRTLTVDGGSPVILINGIPSSINDINALQPKDIEKIEFSRFTPARYADSGKSGYISITLKKRNDGGQVYIWGRSAVNTAFVDANVYTAYHQGPSQFSLNYTPSWRNYQQVYDNNTGSYIGDDFRVDLEEHDRNPFNYHYHALKAKYDYKPTDKTLFSASFSITPNYSKSRSLAHTIDSELGEYDNNNLTTTKDLTPSLDLFLRQDFNEKNSLEVQVVGTLSSSDYRRDNSYFFSNEKEESYIMNVDSRRSSLISEINYNHTFNASTTLSAGYQNTISHSSNTYLSSDYKPVLTENNNYAYARLGQQVGKVFFTLATGAKMFWISNDTNKRHFIKNLSSAQVSWNINQNWSLQGSFQYTPGIPSLTQLTDYAQQTTPYLLANGNPDLKVSNKFIYKLDTNFAFKKFQASFTSAYANYSKNVFEYVLYLGDGKFLSQSLNTKYHRLFQNDLTMRLSNIHGFGATLYLGFRHEQVAVIDLSKKLTSFYSSINLWWNNGPITISYWRKLPCKSLSGYTVFKDENGDALQFEFKPNNHWTLGASWMYMFDKKGTRYPSWNYSTVNPSYRERYIKNNGNMIVLSASYSADFGSIFRTGRRNLNNSDNGSSLLKL